AGARGVRIQIHPPRRASSGVKGGPRRGPPLEPERGAQPPLNGATSGLVLEYRPAGFGYQTHTCIVTRSGSQNVNAAPLSPALFRPALRSLSAMKVPSL